MQTVDQVASGMSTSCGQGAVGGTPVYVQNVENGPEVAITSIFFIPGDVQVSPELSPEPKRVVLRTW